MKITVAQRQAVTALLEAGTDTNVIAAQVGVTPGQVAAVKAHVTMGSYDDVSEAIEAAVTEVVDSAFGLEKDLQQALRRNLAQLEAGLVIADSDREQTVASGRIDITARDRDGVLVVIELKAGTADREAIGQILSYMGDLSDKEASIRGILVARDFAPRAVSAARMASGLSLVRYGFRFSFEPAGGAYQQSVAPDRLEPKVYSAALEA